MGSIRTIERAVVRWRCVIQHLIQVAEHKLKYVVRPAAGLWVGLNCSIVVEDPVIATYQSSRVTNHSSDVTT